MTLENELLESVDNLINSFFDILQIIEKGDDEGKEFSSLICENYPFELSLDEVSWSVINWRDTIIDNIEGKI